jgi:putative ABC transport system permease protein
MKLALSYLLYDKKRSAVCVIGVAFAVVLIVFQGSLLTGFIGAASLITDSCGGDIWIAPQGVSSVEFPAILPRRMADLARGIDGVASVDRLCFGFTSYQRPNGRYYSLALAGLENAQTHPAFPVPLLPGSAMPGIDALAIDYTTAKLLGVEALPERGEIGRKKVSIDRVVSGYSTFLGAPYAFLTYRNASRYMDFGEDETNFLVIRTERYASTARVIDRLQARFPGVKVWRMESFARSAQWYWLTQTGAGGAILSAAVLGFIIGLMVVSQTIYSSTMERVGEFATLKALGAETMWLVRFVIVEALAIGAAGLILGLSLSPLAVGLARQYLVPWVTMKTWLLFATAAVTLLMCVAAVLTSARAVLRLDPAEVFRA